MCRRRCGSLGAKVEMLDADQLAWGDLTRYNAIVTGVRAYEKRPDLRRQQPADSGLRRKGGTVIVQYNRHDRSGFNDAQYGPVSGARHHHARHR